MKVYISGPITGLTPDVYRKAFADRAEWVRAQGWEPVDPCEVDHVSGCSCHNGGDHTWSCYMRTDLLVLLRCDAITTLPGWQGSNGARAEVFVASVAGLRFVDYSEMATAA